MLELEVSDNPNSLQSFETPLVYKKGWLCFGPMLIELLRRNPVYTKVRIAQDEVNKRSNMRNQLWFAFEFLAAGTLATVGIQECSMSL